jgi:hypothetical protein
MISRRWEIFWGNLKNDLEHYCRFPAWANAEASIREYIEMSYNRATSLLGYFEPVIFLEKLQISDRGRLRWEFPLLPGKVNKLESTALDEVAALYTTARVLSLLS